jgi:flagellin
MPTFENQAGENAGQREKDSAEAACVHGLLSRLAGDRSGCAGGGLTRLPQRPPGQRGHIVGRFPEDPGTVGNGAADYFVTGLKDNELLAVDEGEHGVGSTTEYNGLSVFSGSSGGAGSTVTLSDSSKTVTSGAITSGDTLSGSIVLTDAGSSKTGTIDMSNYSGLASSVSATQTAALASLNTDLAATSLGALVTASLSSGALTFTTTGTGNLTHTGTLTQTTPVTGGVNIYTSDGTSTGSKNYGVTVGVLTDASVGASQAGGSGKAISLTVGGDTGTGGTTAANGAGTSLTGTVLTSQANAEAALQTVTNAISAVAYQRGQVGANINTLTAASNIASSEETNVQSAQNNITQTDYAAATSNMSKFEILTQTGISALAQANSTQQMVTKLLQ